MRLCLFTVDDNGHIYKLVRAYVDLIECIGFGFEICCGIYNDYLRTSGFRDLIGNSLIPVIVVTEEDAVTADIRGFCDLEAYAECLRKCGKGGFHCVSFVFREGPAALARVSIVFGDGLVLCATAFDAASA